VSPTPNPSPKPSATATVTPSPKDPVVISNPVPVAVPKPSATSSATPTPSPSPVITKPVTSPSPKPSATVTPTPTVVDVPASAEQYIKVVTPNGGQTFTAGQKVAVSWESIRVKKVWIKLIGLNHSYFVGSVSAQPGVYMWTIPHTVKAGKYQIEVVSVDPSRVRGLLDYSDGFFTINSSVTNVPVVTVPTVPVTKPTPTASQTPITTVVPQTEEVLGVPTGEPIRFIRGDANQDGRVTISDSVVIGQFASGLITSNNCLDALDANDDGKITQADADTVTGYLFSGTSRIASPYPFRGFDKTLDNLTCKFYQTKSTSSTPPTVPTSATPSTSPTPTQTPSTPNVPTFTPVPTGPFVLTGSWFIRGDVNQDGRHDGSDVIALNAFVNDSSATNSCHDALDVNDDGTISIADVEHLNRYLFVGGTRITSPFPFKGYDKTDDALTCASFSIR
jgi:hypothetical protein